RSANSGFSPRKRHFQLCKPINEKDLFLSATFRPKTTDTPVPRASCGNMLKTQQQSRGEVGDALTKIKHADPVRRRAAELRQRHYGGLRDAVINRRVRQNATISRFEGLQ